MKKFKNIASLILCFTLIFTFCSVGASEEKNKLNDNMIKNSILYMTSARGIAWNNIIIVEKTPLYSFDEKLIAYSIDILNNETQEKGYIILSTMEDDGPIYEFAVGVNSPYYYKTKDEEHTYLYNGVMDYYVKKVDEYIDVKRNRELTKDEVEKYKKNAEEKVYKSDKQQAKEFHSLLVSDQLTTSSIISSLSTSSKILSVPDYYYQRGCSPTSAAMIMKYRFPTLPSETTLINELATAMSTSSTGATIRTNIPIGIDTVADNHQILINSYSDGSGKANSTLSEYFLEINNNRPVYISIEGSTQTAPSYPGGFGAHGMAGVGYYKDVYRNFIVVHDTGCDGDVYCDYDASSFGTPMWTYVK